MKDPTRRADALFTLRLRSTDKQRLAEAAERNRQSLASYVLGSAVRRAESELLPTNRGEALAA